MDDVFATVERCVDPFNICWNVIEEVWEEVLEWRMPWRRARKADLYRSDVVRPVEQNRPISYEPDLKAERSVVEGVIDDEAVDPELLAVT